MSFPKPPPLTDAQRAAIRTKLVETLAKPAVKALGDKMARAKRPFWRKVVAFFRGTEAK